MIDEARTLEIYEYTSDKYAEGSHKPVVAVCEECGYVRPVEKRHYSELCFACTLRSEGRRSKISAATSGDKNPMYGVSPSLATRKQIGAASRKMWEDPNRHASHANRMRNNKYREGIKHTQETKEKMSLDRKLDKHPLYGKNPSEETRRKQSVALKKYYEDPKARQKNSAAHQGIEYDDWESFAKDQPYCPNFNEACKESNREKYDRRCFITDLPEAENGQKLSVHHIDMNKQQGCDGHAWKLVPVCKGWHGRTHNETWMARIQYLLEHVWNYGRNNVIS